MADEQPLAESLPFAQPHLFHFATPPWEELGISAGGLPIVGRLVAGENHNKRALLVAGVHGNETEGHAFILGFIREFVHGQKKPPVDVYVLPCLNPDGFFSFKRQNANGVDLNRNMKTKDWQPGEVGHKYYPGVAPESEPETMVLVKTIETFQPHFILSFHSWKPMININGPARPFAEQIALKLPYIITEDIGYPTPGSLGTWAGWERNIPTITLEIERGLAHDTVYPLCRDGVLKGLDYLAGL